MTAIVVVKGSGFWGSSCLAGYKKNNYFHILECAQLGGLLMLLTHALDPTSSLRKLSKLRE